MIAELLLSRARLLILIALVFAGIGGIMWAVMPRQEDPDITNRWGRITVTFPGADPSTVERLLIEPLEDELAEVSGIRWVMAEASEGFGMVNMIMEDSVGPAEIEDRWKDIEDAIERAKAEFPDGTNEPAFDKNISDLESVVLAISGPGDPLALRKAALDVRDELLRLSQVARVTMIGDPGDEIVVALDGSTAQTVGLTHARLAGQLQARNAILPAGSVRSGEKSASLAPVTDLEDLDDIRRTPITLPSGSTVPLSELATVHRGPIEPVSERMRWNGKTAIGLGVIAESDGNLVLFGDTVRRELETIKADIAPFTIEEVAFQPDRVEARISNLGRSLVASMAIVGGIVLLLMGPRMGAVVSAIVPLVLLSALALYALGGGILHQMSVAALVIALGMLVDNAIVVVESIIRRLDDGESPQQAALDSVRELAFPLLTATGTTVAAFVPMLMSQGTVGEFTRSIPVLVTLVLVVSYLYATLVTPVVARWLLRPSSNAGKVSRFDRFSSALGRLAVRRYRLVLILVTAGVIVVGSFGGAVEQNFFPSADRNQVMVELSLPDGTRIEAIDTAASKLEHALMDSPDVESVAAFIGRSAPHFYYNVQAVPQAPQVAQLLVTTTDLQRNNDVEAFIRDFARKQLPGVQVIAAELEQGPAVAAPIELRVQSEDLDELKQASEILIRELNRIEGTESVRDTMSLGAPTLRMDIDDAAAARYGVTRRAVAEALLGETRGLRIGAMRHDDDPVPIVVRSPQGIDTPAEALGGIEVSSLGGTVPLAELVHLEVRWRPARILRRNGERVVYVRSNLAPGYSYSTIVQSMKERLPNLDLPKGIEPEFGGDAEGAGDANSAMFAALPLGLLMLVGFLMVEFNSFRRVLIVLSTVPLAGVGVIPGLLLSGQPFGFMSMLGVIALAGVVVNNAIVLLDVVEQQRAAGKSVEQALEESVRLRMRPILLTTGTTVAGLLPLATSPTSLWPPLASAMISGLIASTVLTLVFVPALYHLLLAPKRTR